MEKYIERTRNYLIENRVEFEDTDFRSVLELLYNCFMEGNTSKEHEVRAYYEQLDGLLRVLPLKDHDTVCDLVSDMCVFHERFAFMEGVRVGGQLALEIMQK